MNIHSCMHACMHANNQEDSYTQMCEGCILFGQCDIYIFKHINVEVNIHI
jgi:hypothetical protein